MNTSRTKTKLNTKTGLVSQDKKPVSLRCCVVFRETRDKTSHGLAFFCQLATLCFFHMFPLFC